MNLQVESGFQGVQQNLQTRGVMQKQTIPSSTRMALTSYTILGFRA